MSINLNLKIDNEKIDLLQTPTQITYMCMVNNDGEIHPHLIGKKALHAIQIYLVWLQYSNNAVYTTKQAEEAAKHRQAGIQEHINEIKNKLKNYKKIEVWVM